MDTILDGIKKFEMETLHACEGFPSLNLIYEEEIPCLKGIVKLVDKDENVIDEYKILIMPTINYPNLFPKVFELGGKIPKNTDWHTYSDGSCCIASPPEEKLFCIEGIDLYKFIQDHVLPYFFNQTFRRENGYFLNERSHGDLGWIEFFFETLKTKSIVNVISVLEIILNKKTFDRTAKCFCGSGEKYRKCHRKPFENLKKLPDEDINLYLQKLRLKV